MNNNTTTPQRPQQSKRRQRYQTISSESPKLLLHPVQSASSIRVQPPQNRTPKQQGKNGGQKLQRQHSVSCCTPTGKMTPPQLLRLQKATAGSQSSLFSGSKFLDSPAPETVPLPPSHWFSNVVELVPAVRTSPTPSAASDSMSSASSIESSSSDELLSTGYEQRGFKINPMQLIAAVSAVV
jgi:hypothetical protein